MKTNRSSAMVRNLLLTLVGALVFAGVANTQPPSYIGKFTLPFDARWGLAILPAGDYSFTLDSEGEGGTLKLSCGMKNVALIPNQNISRESPGRSA